MSDKLRKKLLVVKNSDAEAAVIEELANKYGTNESNVIRRLLKAAAEAEGIDVTDLFYDGSPGNRQPKPKGKDDPPTKLSDRRAYNNTGMGVSAPAPVVSS
jgi:hypothetical protein